MREFLKKKGANENFFNMYATIDLLRVYYDHTAQEYFIDLGQREYEVEHIDNFLVSHSLPRFLKKNRELCLHQPNIQVKRS